MLHRARSLLIAIALPAIALADDAPKDPLQLLQQHSQQAAKAISPSTMPADRLSPAIDKGFKFLDAWQSPDGSWNRIGEIDSQQENDTDLEWRITDGKYFLGKEYRDGPVKDSREARENANIADTALAARAMLAAVIAGRHPEYAPKIKKSIDFLCRQIDTWNGGDKMKTIYIQSRFLDPLHDVTPSLGESRYYDSTIDTFFVLSFLAKASQSLTDEQLKTRVDRALHILQFKIESTQNLAGTWTNETDPVAKIADTDSDPSQLFPMFKKLKPPRPRVPRTSPENMNLPEGPQWRAEQYDMDHKNILIHCEYVRDLSQAASLGVALKMETLLRAEQYLKQTFDENKWESLNNGPYAKNVCPKAILITSVVAAWYQADITAQELLKQAQLKRAAGQSVTDSELASLLKHAEQTHAQLERQVNRFIKYNNPPICGPALENLADCIAAVSLFNDTAARQLAKDIALRMLTRQRKEGNFIAGPNDDWRQYQWIGTDRGESIFGTATTLNLLLFLENQSKQNP